jgi:hypothetical protein
MDNRQLVWNTISFVPVQKVNLIFGAQMSSKSDKSGGDLCKFAHLPSTRNDPKRTVWTKNAVNLNVLQKAPKCPFEEKSTLFGRENMSKLRFLWSMQEKIESREKRIELVLVS